MDERFSNFTGQEVPENEAGEEAEARSRMALYRELGKDLGFILEAKNSL